MGLTAGINRQIWLIGVILFSSVFGPHALAQDMAAAEKRCAAFIGATPSHIQLIHKLQITPEIQASLISSLNIMCQPETTPENVILEAVDTALTRSGIPMSGLERIDDANTEILTISVRAVSEDSQQQSLLLPVSVELPEDKNPLRLAELVGVPTEGEMLQLRYLVEETAVSVREGRLQVRWLRDGRPIEQASGGRYRLGLDDVGAEITAEIQLLSASGALQFALRTSASDQIAMAEYLPEALDVTLAGEPVVGGELVVDFSFFDRNPDDFEAGADYIWIRDNEVITGQNADRLELTEADIGKKITVRVVPRSSDGQAGKATLKTLNKAIAPKPIIVADEVKPSPVPVPIESVVTVAVPTPRPALRPAVQPTDEGGSDKAATDEAQTIARLEAADELAPDAAVPTPSATVLDTAPKDDILIMPKPVVPPAPPIELTTGLTIAATGPKTLAGISFTPTGILQDEILRDTAESFRGEPISLETIRDVLEVMNTAYRDAGYELSRALLPEQHIDDGVLTIQLVDAKIGQITLENQKALQEAFILRQLGLSPGDFIDLYELEVAIRRYNANNKSKITSELAAGSGFGETDIFLDVAEPDRIELPTISVNNYSNQISDWQAGTFSTTLNNLIGIDDELSLSFSDSNGSVSQGASLSIPLFDDGTNLTISHTSNRTKSTTGSEDTVGYRGKSQTTGISYSHPVIFTDDYSLYFSGSYGQSNADLVQPVTGLKLSQSETKKLSLGVPMSYSTGLTTISLSPLWSVINSKTLIPETNIWVQKAEVDLSIAQYINPYVTANFRSKMMYSGSRHMINMPSETITVGGPGSVRAYQPSESSGYQGYFVSAELRTDLANWDNMTMPEFAPNIQPYIFVDHAMAQTQYKKRIRADYWSGAGIGVSIPSLFNFLTFDAYWAHPLDGDVHEAEKEAYEDELFQFSLSAKFRLQ